VLSSASTRQVPAFNTLVKCFEDEDFLDLDVSGLSKTMVCIGTYISGGSWAYLGFSDRFTAPEITWLSFSKSYAIEVVSVWPGDPVEPVAWFPRYKDLEIWERRVWEEVIGVG
jgi:hypothetical protein